MNEPSQIKRNYNTSRFSSARFRWIPRFLLNVQPPLSKLVSALSNSEGCLWECDCDMRHRESQSHMDKHRKCVVHCERTLNRYPKDSTDIRNFQRLGNEGSWEIIAINNQGWTQALTPNSEGEAIADSDGCIPKQIKLDNPQTNQDSAQVGFYDRRRSATEKVSGELLDLWKTCHIFLQTRNPTA